MSLVQKLEPVLSTLSTSSSDLQVFISIVNYYENALFVVTIAHDEEEAQKLIAEMLSKASERDPNIPGLYAQPGRFESWWNRDNDLLYDELINEMSSSKQCLKLDFKDPEIIVPCLELLKERKLKQPIFLNADVLQGNGASISKFNAIGFITLCRKIYPEGILSTGWTTVSDPKFLYTQENVDQMFELVKDFEEVTFPVRACLISNSWKQLQRLIKKEGFSLTIWNNEPVDGKLQNWLKENTDPIKTFYDFIDENKNPLRFW
ncbi:hypothetical protein A2382_03165 [Candidatus Woesebacteria bacterium RIFOXYB1_FULL_38_16]|uniref:Menorin-like domain-containing protein n=1 Tax=Candidatus Woesebacteria bacterium RIFOXYB1_FULL_38_16 TaxID=1802538 RepID=A0A1F8CUE5_9BACT|nr:MAG: hypothetical protein A2191_02315 [Candidatus Woesebacteria bacterium RIFOXYA1_FULL_38_9]OGM79901.1 MAG: hypothetical protein A2382_03165 [Candidatus Woesebacteria bacterium RIFOXYB1_FULL_38_16]